MRATTGTAFVSAGPNRAALPLERTEHARQTFG
jgi:hypothetical protein